MAMIPLPLERLRAAFPRTMALVEPYLDVLRKSISFALIGVVNVLIDASIFFVARSYLEASPAALRPLDAFAEACQCTSHESIVLIAANIMAWLVAVSCSYVMNSHITFAAESGRRLRFKSYVTFVASGVLGALASTTTLVIAAKFMPVVAAKGLAILASFVFNFSMSHFVVFRRTAREDVTS
jgi:putative flippase GtrA